MKVIYNTLIPSKGFRAINLFGVLFVRTGCEINSITINHETIHTAQMKEMLYVFFYLAYIGEWLYHLYRLKDRMKAYRAISFEREARKYQYDAEYLKTRPMYNQYKEI